MKKVRFLLIFLFLLFVLDRLTKYLAILKLPIAGVFVLPFLELKLFFNPWLALSLPLNGILIIAVSSIILVVLVSCLIKTAQNNLKSFLALGLIFAGACSNFIDRLRFGAVIDFLNLPYFPAFNLSDLYISIGAVLLLLSLRKPHWLALKTETTAGAKQADSK